MPTCLNARDPKGCNFVFLSPLRSPFVLETCLVLEGLDCSSDRDSCSRGADSSAFRSTIFTVSPAVAAM